MFGIGESIKAYKRTDTGSIREIKLALVMKLKKKRQKQMFELYERMLYPTILYKYMLSIQSL